MKKALLFISIVIGLCIFWPRGSSKPNEPTRYALLVGAEEAAAAPDGVKAATEDPAKIAKILEKYGHFEQANITLLTPKTKELPTHDAIMDALDDLVAKTDENDEVILFFIGHGTRWKEEDYFLPVGLNFESATLFWSNVISHTAISDLARKMRAQSVITIYENCRADGETSQMRPEIPEKHPMYTVDRFAGRSNRLRVTLFSCMPYQYSYRKDSGTTGFFSDALQQALEGSASKNHQVTIDSALKFARIWVFGQVRKDVGVAQIPFASVEEGTLSAAQKFVLSGPFETPAKNVDNRLIKWGIAMSGGYEQMLAGDMSKSLKEFENASHLYPDSLWAWFEQAFILEDMHQKVRAQKVLAEAVKYQKMDANGNFQLGSKLHQWGYWTTAEKLYRQSLKLKPDNPEVLCWLGLLKLSQNKLNEAEALENKVIKRVPQWSAPHSYLAKIYASRKQFDKAELYYRKACSLDTKNWQTWMELGFFLQHTRQHYLESESIYRRCIQMEPTRPDLLMNLADCLLKQGRTDEAREQVEQAQKLGIKPTPAIKYLLDLTSTTKSE